VLELGRAEPQAEPLRPAVRRAPRAVPGRSAAVNRARLRDEGYLVPDGAPGALAEELRLVKRRLLQAVSARTGLPDAKRRSVLVCSGQADEGKTFCAVNLALSLASEQDVEVLLVDGDVLKPELLPLLGIEDGPGLIDALVDPEADAESFIVRTDIEGLSVLPAGRQANNVPELLASERTREVLAALADADPRRIVLFDSPPVLLASSAGVLASHVGQVLVVVRADATVEADLRETIALLSGCDNVALLLNQAGFAAGGRRFGQYYGQEP
jgi:exopolysaccharide/PEP-CTERM locus tyrosine autokinase